MDKFHKINQKFLVVPKLLYFSIATAFYVFHQFRGQFICDTFNVDKSDLGFYLSIPQFLSFFSTLYVGAINDRSGKQKLLIFSLLVLGGFFFQSFFVGINSFTFWYMYAAYFCLISATLPLLDKVMLDYVSEIPGMGPKAFGSQRIWSTFGYLFTNFTVEHLITDKDSKDLNYSAMPVYNWIAVVVTGALILTFVRNFQSRQSSTNYLSSMRSLVSNLEYMYFIFIILLCGISRAFMTNYLGIYYSKVLNFKDQPNTLNLFWPLNRLADWGYAHKQSTSTLFGVALEILIFYNSSYVTDKLGLLWPIFLSQVFQALRFLAYYSLSYENENSFAFCCLIELLKGASYSFIHTSALQLANSFSPPNLRTTSQLIYNGVFVAIGTVAAGLFFKSYFSKTTDEMDVSVVYKEFNSAFKANIIFALVSLAFFLWKYAISENLLFSRENTQRKLQSIENEARLEGEQQMASVEDAEKREDAQAIEAKS